MSADAHKRAPTDNSRYRTACNHTPSNLAIVSDEIYQHTALPNNFLTDEMPIMRCSSMTHFQIS